MEEKKGSVHHEGTWQAKVEFERRAASGKFV